MWKRPAPGYIANFDSATAVLRGTAAYLSGHDYPALGLPRVMKPVARGVNLLARRPREKLYALSGGNEAWPARKMDGVDAEALARWMVGEYPRRRYPVVVMGSSNGAAVHLCAALDAPYLPQTILIPARRSGIHPDEMADDMEWGREPGRRLLDANPDLQLHHMHDPNQDRWRIEYMTYFRVKRLRLGPTLERFLRESLEPGGTILMLDCARRWPVVTLGERHYFQPGATGGLDEEDYLHGSSRVAEFLARYSSHRRSWDPPRPDARAPEAEWGFEPAMAGDVARFAAEHGFDVRRLAFHEPEDLSPLVADLYRWWYARRGIRSSRLFVESFMLIEPWWTLRTGAVPFWCKFPVEGSAHALERYLNRSDPFDEILITLFSHGTESAGLAPIERWRGLMARARTGADLIGVDPDEFPLDFGVFGRYHDDLERVRARYPLPGFLTLDELDRFLAERGEAFAVGWQESLRRAA